MRNAFISELIAQARLRPDVFLIVGDLGYSVVEPFAAEFPDRFLNAGVAEQNMTGLAAGLASEGYHVFTYSIANFPTFRCLEQIRNDVCYHALPVTVVAVGGGLSYGNLGYSHHAVQDFAVMRCLPGMVIASPGDPPETRACVQWLCENPTPSYLRLGKAGEPVYHTSPIHVGPGALLSVRGDEHPARVFLTTGSALGCAMRAIASAEIPGQWAVHSCPLWGDEFKPIIVDALGGYASVIAIEDHVPAGGFCSFLREAIADNGELQSRLRTASLDPRVLGMVGTQDVLNDAGGLGPGRLTEMVAACNV